MGNKESGADEKLISGILGHVILSSWSGLFYLVYPGEQVYIKTLKMSNFKCFDMVELDLDRGNGSFAGWTVFAGVNGAGKSTLLQAMALGVAGFESNLAAPDDFLREGQEKWTISLELTRGPLDQSDPPGPFPCNLDWSASFQKDDRAIQGIEYTRFPGWYLAGYGPSRRLSGHSSEALNQMKSKSWALLTLTLFRNDASLANSIAWLKDTDYRSLKGENNEGFKKLKEDALTILKDGLLPNDVEIMDVTPMGLIVKSNNSLTTLNRLSDGYQAVTALVTDILAGLFARFGSLQLDYVNGSPVIPHEGVILIDEVETHLHISWQRKLGFWLKQHFPNIQFLVCTHSPYVCQAADARGIVRVFRSYDSYQLQHVDDNLFNTIVNGSCDDASVSELFGLDYTHSDNAEKLQDRLAFLEVSLLHKKLTANEKKNFNLEREKILGQLPGGGRADLKHILGYVENL